MTTPPPEDWIIELAERLGRGEAVRRELPGGGRLQVDRPLPYLLVHRSRPGSPDRVTHRLVGSEASHLVWRAGPDESATLAALIRAVVDAGSREYGAFLLLEVWAEPEPGDLFRIRCPAHEARDTVAALEHGLSALRGIHRELRVVVEPTRDRHPPDLPPLLSITEAYGLECLLLGVEVPTVYLQPDESGRAYPVFFRRFKEWFSRALRQAVFEFMRAQTTARVDDYRVLGARTVGDATWQVDRALEAIDRAFDFLLLVSPIDEAEAWERFRSSGFQQAPEFHYRLLPVDPDLLKRRLYQIELERVEDPALHYLLADKRDELDLRIAMLGERGTPDFLYRSIRLHHPVDEDLLRLAEEILAAIPAPDTGAGGDRLDAAAFRARAVDEFAHYRARHPDFSPEIQVRPDLVGVMVSNGDLLIDARLSLEPARMEALIQHEVGTHVLTYFNGSAQPLRQLASGLAAYDELQEGLGILAEYLAGGLTRARMRVLAARVIAARAVEGGADFVETFRQLHDGYGFGPTTAFDIATRAHEGGGHTRDLIYLRGFTRLLRYLESGGELEPLYIGKIGQQHIPVVRELRSRGILRDPPLRPRFLDRPETARRLEALRRGPDLARLVLDEAP